MVRDWHASDALGLEVEGLTKSFGSAAVLRGVNLRVRPGEVLALCGPNGSGKTTLIRILATLSKPTGGRACLAGADLVEEAAQVRRLIGVAGHQTFLYGELTAQENLAFYGRMYGVPELTARIGQLLHRVGLEAQAHQRVDTFSRGMQQRLTLARALLHGPRILLLDEPDTGLDQQGAKMLAEILAAAAAEGCAALLTTHHLERGLALGDRVVILARGRIVFEAQKGEISGADLAEAYRRHTAASA